MIRSLVKRYGVIFICLTIRAVHIEVAHSLDTDSFLVALRGFIARRGQVQEIRSDNGTNITSGVRECRESIQAWNNEKIHEAMLQKSIKWSFNPPCGSHHGGIWERCIRSLRKNPARSSPGTDDGRRRTCHPNVRGGKHSK